MAVAGGAGVAGGAVLDAGCEGEQEQRTPEQRTPALRETGRARAEAGCWRLQLWPLSHSTHSLTLRAPTVVGRPINATYTSFESTLSSFSRGSTHHDSIANKKIFWLLDPAHSRDLVEVSIPFIALHEQAMAAHPDLAHSAIA